MRPSSSSRRATPPNKQVADGNELGPSGQVLQAKFFRPLGRAPQQTGPQPGPSGRPDLPTNKQGRGQGKPGLSGRALQAEFFHRTARPPGRRIAGLPGHRAFGSPGRQATRLPGAGPPDYDPQRPGRDQAAKPPPSTSRPRPGRQTLARPHTRSLGSSGRQIGRSLGLPATGAAGPLGGQAAGPHPSAARPRPGRQALVRPHTRSPGSAEVCRAAKSPFAHRGETGKIRLSVTVPAKVTKSQRDKN